MDALSRLQRCFGHTVARRRWCARPLVLEGLEDRLAPAGFIAVGTDAGVPAQVRIFADNDANGTYETLVPNTNPLAVFSPFPGFLGGVRVAMGDFDGDGNDELVTAAGPGGGPHVIIWDLNADGTIGGVIDSFYAFSSGFGGGTFVAAGDLNFDGIDELAIAADAGGSSHVRVFSDTDSDGLLSDNETDSFFPYGSFSGGVRIAFGNTNNSGGDELICAAGPGGGPHVVVFTDSDNDLAVSDNTPVESFFAYAPGFSAGVYVAAGTIEGAGGTGAEIITGPGAGGGPHVRIFTDSNANGMVSDNPEFESFFAYGVGFTGGVRVAAGDSDLSGAFVEVLTGTGPGGGPHVKIFDDNGDGGSLLADNPLDFEFNAYPPGYNAGVFLAFGKVNNATFSSQSTVSLPDTTTTVADLDIPAAAGIIRDLDISLFISHTHDPDLDVTLTHVASGLSVVLFTDVPTSSADGFIVRLNDESGTDIGGETGVSGAPLTGAFNPEGMALLSTFDGLDASGLWQLTITDDAGGDTGTLFGWSLHLSF